MVYLAFSLLDVFAFKIILPKLLCMPQEEAEKGQGLQLPYLGERKP